MQLVALMCDSVGSETGEPSEMGIITAALGAVLLRMTKIHISHQGGNPKTKQVVPSTVKQTTSFTRRVYCLRKVK